MNEKFAGAFSLEGKTAFITGGGTGLGFAMADSLASAGAQVILAGRREDVLKEACRKIGKKAGYVQFDVTETDRTESLVSALQNEYGHLDILINNAGRHCKKPFSEVTQEDLQKVLDVHILGHYALTRAVLPGMIERRDGSVIFISSMSAYLAMTQVCAYGTAKSAVLGLVKTLSGEVSEYGVRVNAIAPGFIDTPMFRQATDGDPARQQKILGHTPMARYGKPEDVGWAAVYLAAPASRFVTGVCLPVDGGCAIGF